MRKLTIVAIVAIMAVMSFGVLAACGAADEPEPPAPSVPAAPAPAEPEAVTELVTALAEIGAAVDAFNADLLVYDELDDAAKEAAATALAESYADLVALRDSWTERLPDGLPAGLLPPNPLE